MWRTHGCHWAEGNLVLVADIPMSASAARSLLDIPGFRLQNMQGGKWQATVNLGQFRFFGNGDFEAADLTVGFSAKASTFRANIGWQ